ncbi:MAG: hypothetical protein WC884_03470 [Candidatus Paceibacterota bacterium]
MINLIPNQEKKKKVKDFYFRLTVIFFLALGICILIASFSILPSYFISSIKRDLANTKLEMQKNEPILLIDKNFITIIEDLNKKLDLIENVQKNKYLVSQKVINEIVLRKMSDIKINQISYEDNLLSGKTISIHGMAPSRERLLLFRRALEDDVAFKKIDLPISNFTKGSNIEFYLNIIPS